MGNTRGKKISRKARIRRRKRAVRTGGVVCVCILLIFFVITLMKIKDLSRLKKDLVMNGVRAGGADVSGMTRDEVMETIKSLEKTWGEQMMTLKAGENQTQITLAQLGFAVKEPEKLAERAVSLGKEGNLFKRHRELKKAEKNGINLKAEYILDQKTAESALKETGKSLEQAARNARIEKNGDSFTIIEEKAGRKIDPARTREVLTEYLNGKWKGKAGSIKAVITEDVPKVTKEMLSEVDSELGSYTTYCGSGSGRVQNIETGSARISGSVILPGEEFSADEAMRPYTVENGYTEAGSYENGTVVQSMGGGICQVSTTLYNAVLYAELEVTRRQPHSMLVDYVSPSRDAAIADDVKDFRFKNSTEAPVYIECVVAREELTIRIYGKETRPDNRKVDYESEVLETFEKTVRYQEDSGSSIGSYDTVSYGHTGKRARLWKVIYENGQETSREVINESEYNMSPDIVSVGTASDSQEASEIVRSAIDSQDWDTIQSAVNQAWQAEAGRQGDGDSDGGEEPDSGTAGNETETEEG